MDKIAVFLEAGKKRTFAGAIEWPGWCRSGQDEATALAALNNVAHRYAAALGPSEKTFRFPVDITVFNVVERIAGDSTTDFGAPGKILSSDAWPVDANELHRFQDLLKSFWEAFDTTVRAAAGKALRKGPRGGGRDLDKIVGHVIEADLAYLASLGWKFQAGEGTTQEEKLRQTRLEILKALSASAHGEIPTIGPRGGIRWTARTFVRRLAWHLLDHTWEIEDRIC